MGRLSRLSLKQRRERLRLSMREASDLAQRDGIHVSYQGISHMESTRRLAYSRWLTRKLEEKENARVDS